MNIQVQLCALAILLVLVFFFLTQKKVGIYTEQIFFKTLMITLFSVSFDAISIIAIHYDISIPKWLEIICCKTYLVSLVFLGCMAFLYVMTDVYDMKRYHELERRVHLFVCLEGILVLLLPIYVHKNERVVYTYGVAVLATYLFALSYVILTFYVLFKNQKQLVVSRRLAVLTWMGMWMVAATIQFFNNALLLVGFASALGMMIIFFALENPKSNVDREYDCFHSQAFGAYMKYSFEEDKKQSILHISMSAKDNSKLGELEINKCMHELVEFLSTDKEAKVFKNVEQEITVVYSDMSAMTKSYQEIQNKFYLVLDSYFPASLFVLISDTTIINSFEELLHLFRYTKYENRQMMGTQVCYVTDYIMNELREKTDMEHELIQAIEEDRIEVFFQPIYSVHKQKFESAEALVRIRTVDNEIIPPSKFIPIAEERGMISVLGECVFDKTCNFIKQNNIRETLGLNYIEVNLSVLQCEQTDLAERYICIMEHYGISPDMINLEITETGSVQTKKNLIENMNRLINYGLTFSLDDFGNGHSNLDYVIEMPVSIMKLDMSMVQAYFRDAKAKFVMQATVQMAHDMELCLVSEGVESAEQLEEMQKIGVDYVQGYYFSKPLPENEFVAFLQEKNK